jgi:hypothetical protein
LNLQRLSKPLISIKYLAPANRLIDFLASIPLFQEVPLLFGGCGNLEFDPRGRYDQGWPADTILLTQGCK